MYIISHTVQNAFLPIKKKDVFVCCNMFVCLFKKKKESHPMLFHLILPTWSSQSYMKEIPKKDALPTGNYAKFQVPTVYSLIKQKNIF